MCACSLIRSFQPCLKILFTELNTHLSNFFIYFLAFSINIVPWGRGVRPGVGGGLVGPERLIPPEHVHYTDFKLQELYARLKIKIYIKLTFSRLQYMLSSQPNDTR